LLYYEVGYNIETTANKMSYLMSDEISITSQQSRGARAMLGWTRDELAQRSKVSAATLADFEAGKRVPYDRTLADIRRALEDGGIEFIPENGGGPGARLRKTERTDKVSKSSKGDAPKAAELAAREIDRLSDKTATGEERASRKRRLIKGPKEFRGIRRK
jgi:transcriptional regulator with XRE-family HTH domain